MHGRAEALEEAKLCIEFPSNLMRVLHNDEVMLSLYKKLNNTLHLMP
jgi:hypothetical protein